MGDGAPVSSQWPWRLLWTALWLALAVFAAARFWGQRQYAIDQQQWEAASPQREADADRVRDQLDGLIGRPRGEVEQVINGGRPFASDERFRHISVAKFVDPKSHHTFTLLFGSDALLTSDSAVLVLRAATMSWPKPPPPRRFWHWLETARGCMAGHSLMAWVCALALAIAVRPMRRFAATLMVWLTVAGGVSWALGPMGFARVPMVLWPDDYRGTEALGQWQWLIIMAAVSIPVVLWAYRRPPSSEPLCWQCGYNLIANTSGVCPMCGKRISPALKWLISQHPVGDITQRFDAPSVDPADLVAGPGQSAARPSAPEG